MKALRGLQSLAVAAVAAVFLSACGGAPPLSIADLPAYAGATELQPGNSPIATTLRNNEQQAAAMGQKIEQKAYNLPRDASWEKVVGFYDDQLKGAGWKSGVAVGGLGSGMANEMVSKALSQANAGSDLFKTAMFTRGKQTLTVMRVADASRKGDAQLLLSLNTR